MISLASHRFSADNEHRSKIKMLGFPDTPCSILLGDRPLSYQEKNSRMTEAWVSCINRSDRSETCSLAKSVNYAVAEGAHNAIGRQTNSKELVRRSYLGYSMFCFEISHSFIANIWSVKRVEVRSEAEVLGSDFVFKIYNWD